MVQLAFGVSQTLTAIFLFPAILITAHWTLGRFIGLVLPTWPVVIVCLLHVPCRILFKVMRERWEAERAGAVRPPRIRGRWIGDLDLLSKLSETFKNGYFSDFLWEGADELGPLFDLHIFWTNNFLTCHPDHIKTILAGDFSNFEKGSIFRDTMYSVLGTGVFNSDGDMWKFHRGMTRPFFNRDRITHFDLFDHHAGEAIRRMKDRLQAGYAIDFQDVISRFTLDSATEFLFGSCVHSLASDLPYPHFVASSSPPEQASNPADDFAHAFFEVQEIIAGRTRQGFTWPFIEIFKDRTAEPMKVVNAYIDPILKEAVEKSKNGPEDKKNVTDVDENETLLDHLVKCTKDPVVLRDEILNIMIAGRDTTASSLTFAVYFLCMYPHVLQRLREEILDTVGPTRRPTSDDIRQMKYLRAVINETLRLYPPVPINVRYNTKATTWPNPLDPNGKPFYIPADSSCAYSVFMMHRRKEYWGPDAEEFDPDRFLDERLGKYLTPNPFIFLPFNAGPRICLGQQFAYNEMSFFLIRLLQNFSSMMLDPVAQPPDSRPPTEWAQAMGRRKAIERFFPKVHLTMYSKGGLWVKMIEATANSEAPKLD